MKKIITLGLVILLLFGMPFALAQQAAIVDNADVLSASQESALSDKIDGMYEDYGIQVMLYLVNDGLDMYSLRVAAADAYEARGFKDEDGIIMALDTASRKYYFVTAGAGRTIFGESALDELEDAVVPYLRSNSFAYGVTAFVNETDDILGRSSLVKLGMGLTGIASALLDKLPMAALFGAVLASIILAVRIYGMKTGRRRNTANQYVIKTDLSRRADVYLYTTETRHRIETSSGGGGGGHGGGGGSFHSSSGGSYGGRGGSF